MRIIVKLHFESPFNIYNFLEKLFSLLSLRKPLKTAFDSPIFNKFNNTYFYGEEKWRKSKGFNILPLLSNVITIAGLSIFSSVPVLYYLQVVIFIKIWTIFMDILYNSLKSGGTKDHFRWVKVPGTAPYWNAHLCLVVPFIFINRHIIFLKDILLKSSYAVLVPSA